MLYSSSVFSPRSSATERTSAATTAPSKTTPASAPACHVGTHVPLRGATVKTHADEKTLTVMEVMATPESDVGSGPLLLSAGGYAHVNAPVPLVVSCDGAGRGKAKTGPAVKRRRGQLGAARAEGARARTFDREMDHL